MGDVGLAVQRAEDKTAQMQARAGAIDELLASGALDDQLALGGGSDDIDRELAALSSGSDVEAELARMKAVSGGAAPKAIDATGPADTSDSTTGSATGVPQAETRPADGSAS
jgi:phage shock protein A